MATGDIRNNLRKLKTELKKVNYTDDLDFEQMVNGISGPFLPIMHHIFVDYSVELSTYFSFKGYDFYGKNDLRFLEVIYKILIQEFGLKPMLTKQQFFAIGYAEVKVIFVTRIVELCWKKNQEILNKLGKKKTQTLSVRTSKVNQQTAMKQSKPNMDNFIPLNQKNASIIKRGGSRQAKPSMVEKHYTPPMSMPPLPNPDLTLTPIKVSPIQEKYVQKDVDLACSLLDVTELEDDIVDQSNIEIVDIDNDIETLPKFVITKHNDVAFVDNCFTSIRENMRSEAVIQDHENNGRYYNQTRIKPPFESKTVSTHTKHMPAYSNSNLADLKQQPKDQEDSRNKEKEDYAMGNSNQECHQCSQCQVNTQELSKLSSQLALMTKQFNDVISINNDLSAKLILMDTRVKLMENVAKNQNVTNKLQPIVMESKIKTSDGEHIEVLSHELFTQERKEYSPVKYTDDDVIIKDFKPLRMTDVRKLLQKNDTENKENVHETNHFNRKKRNSLDKDSVHFEVAHIGILEDSMISDSPNVSHIFHNDNTKQMVRDVKKRLLDTEKLLKNSASNLI